MLTKGAQSFFDNSRVFHKQSSFSLICIFFKVSWWNIRRFLINLASEDSRITSDLLEMTCTDLPTLWTCVCSKLPPNHQIFLSSPLPNRHGGGTSVCSLFPTERLFQRAAFWMETPSQDVDFVQRPALKSRCKGPHNSSVALRHRVRCHVRGFHPAIPALP